MSVPFQLDALVGIAEAAAALTRTAAAGPLDVAQKADLSPVTAVDKAVDAFLKRELTALAPGSAWLSEESLDDRARFAAPMVWIVDPIDGTKQLVRGIPEVAISIGLVREGDVVAAAVINPMTGEQGAWIEGSGPVFLGLVPVRRPRALREAAAIVSRTETEDGVLVDLLGLVGATRPVGSVAYKLLRVAAGADALTYSVYPKNEWDVCGGVGLIRAAGLAYLRLDGAEVTFNQQDARIPSGAVAGPESLALALREKINARRR